MNNGLVQHDIPLDWLDVFRAHGIAVGGWGYEDSKPLIEAVLADLAVRRYGLEFFIADAESQYEQTKKLHGWGRSKIFVEYVSLARADAARCAHDVRGGNGAVGPARSTTRAGGTPGSICSRRRTTTNSRRPTGLT